MVDASEALFRAAGVPFEETSELQRQLMAAFAFGMLHVEGQVNRLTHAEVHALTLAYLMDAFHYRDHQAADFAQLLILSAADPNHHPTINAVIHQGIDGHFAWLEGRDEELRKGMRDVFQAVSG